MNILNVAFVLLFEEADISLPNVLHDLSFVYRLKKKFDNAIKEMEGRHGLAISQLDSKFEKTISNRPRY